MTVPRSARSALDGAASPVLAAAEATTPLDVAMNRYADGDDSAFNELFRELGPRLRAFLRRLSGSEELADDLTQETFIRMHQARGSFARGRSVVPWAYAIARNAYISSTRTAKSKIARTSLDVTELDVAAGPDADAEAAIATKQSIAVVERALAGMTVARREAFILLRYEGLSVAEAAQISGVSESALKVRAFHAYEILRQALRSMEQERSNTPRPEP